MLTTVEYAWVSERIARKLCAAHGFKLPKVGYETLVKYDDAYGWLRRTTPTEARNHDGLRWYWRRTPWWRLDERNRAILSAPAAREGCASD